MSKSQPGKEKREILEALRARGIEVSERQFRDWRQEGLIPRPAEESGLGRGRGKQSFYPPGTVEQAADLKWALDQRRSFDWAGWYLWTKGYPVTGFIRSNFQEVIGQRIDDLQSALEQFRSGDPDNPVVRVSQCGPPRGLEWLGRPATKEQLAMLTRVFLDALEEPSSPDQMQRELTYEGGELNEALRATIRGVFGEVGVKEKLISGFLEEFEKDPGLVTKPFALVFEELNPESIEAEFSQRSDHELIELREEARAVYQGLFPEEEADWYPVFCFTLVIVIKRLGGPEADLVRMVEHFDRFPELAPLGQVIRSLAQGKGPEHWG